MNGDPFAHLKAVQREAWAAFSPQATFTVPPAASLVAFAGVRSGDLVLDVACGTGVVAVTAARIGARVRGLDLAPALLTDARKNAALAASDIDFVEGDVEALPYPDATFDVVLSQFGHTVCAERRTLPSRTAATLSLCATVTMSGCSL